MIKRSGGYALTCCLLMAAQTVFTSCYAKPQEQQQGKTEQATAAETQNANTKPDQSGQQQQPDEGQADTDQFTETKLGLSLLKNIVLDEKAIWTSPTHLASRGRRLDYTVRGNSSCLLGLRYPRFARSDTFALIRE